MTVVGRYDFWHDCILAVKRDPIEVLVLRQPRRGLAAGVKAMAKAVAARTEHIRRVASVGDIG
jgi:hypothetical protein